MLQPFFSTLKLTSREPDEAVAEVSWKFKLQPEDKFVQEIKGFPLAYQYNMMLYSFQGRAKVLPES